MSHSMAPLNADDLDGLADRFPVWERLVWPDKHHPVWPPFFVKPMSGIM
jgi:hypothetical protein